MCHLPKAPNAGAACAFPAFFAVLLSGAIIFGSRHFANPLNSIDSFGLPIGFLVTAALPLILMLIFMLHARRCTRLDRRQQLAEDG